MVGWLIDDGEKVYNLENFFSVTPSYSLLVPFIFLLVMMWIEAQVLLEENKT